MPVVITGPGYGEFWIGDKNIANIVGAIAFHSQPQQLTYITVELIAVDGLEVEAHEAVVQFKTRNISEEVRQSWSWKERMAASFKKWWRSL